ncbi:sugar ABC transporter substrate-binding protein [Clostridia bacterium]|nr:sugar ABC transporter substrate-binding protein [Clostridia bacterium]
MKKRLTICMLTVVMVMLLAACSGSGSGSPAASAGGSTPPAQSESSGHKIGLSLPTQAQTRWSTDGVNFQSLCDAAGLELVTTWADDDASKQISDIENLISQGVDALIVSAVDELVLDPACKLAKEQGVWVVSYERFLLETQYVDYYVRPAGLRPVGVLQGNFFVDHFNLAADDDKTYTIEMFAGTASTAGARDFFDGALEALQPYFDSGKLVCKSGQTDFLTVAIENYAMNTAQDRMDNLLTAYYSDGVAPDMVLSPNDSIALGIVNALKNAGYTDPDNFPAITGQDCDIPNIKLMQEGFIAQNVYKDLYAADALVIKGIQDYYAGNEPQTNAVTNNGVFDVPTMEGNPVNVTQDNWYEILIDGGVMTLADLGLTEADIKK